MKKRTFTQVLSFLLILIMIVSVCPVYGMSSGTTGTTEDGIVYEILDEEITITGYAGDNSKVNIPSTIMGYPVRSIGIGAFKSTISAPLHVTEVVIPDGVTSIGVSAFSGCGIKKIKIPDSVTSIGSSAFYWCQSLESITLPKSVTYIGEAAFLYSAYYNNSGNWQDNMLYINSALIGAKESISGDYSIKNGTTVIADKAFYGCSKLKSVFIPEGITNVSDYTFYECKSLESVALPMGIKTIGNNAFARCSSLKSVTIPTGTVSVGESAFYYCTSLEDVAIPESVTKIGDGAFSQCHSLGSITIPSGITSIGNTMFSCCTSLKSITIPEGVTSVGDRAFVGCTSLDSITIPSTVKSIGVDAFYETAFTNSQDNWQDGVLYIDSALIIADWLKLNSKEYIIKEGTTVIADCAFYNCKLENLIIPSSVTSIGFKAFGSCSSLKSITIPEQITNIKEFAFYDCSALTDIYFGGSRIQWNVVSSEKNKEHLKNVNIHFAKEAVYLLGDANIDGKVNVKDATHIQKAAASIVVLDLQQRLLADTDLNELINVKDATAIQKWVAGIDVDFPIGEEKII